jgi:hypothetical protein
MFKTMSIRVLFCLMIFGPGFHLTYAQQKEKTFRDLNRLLVNTVMDDLFPPPIASRIYVYPQIAFYECIRHEDARMETLAGRLNGLNEVPALPANKPVDHFIAACIAFSSVTQGLVGSEYKIEDWRKGFTDSLMLHSDTVMASNSIRYGQQVADSIIAWSKKDNYLRSRGLMRNVIQHKPGAWQPTPVDYAPGLEPNWYTIRPMTLTSASQFSPKEKLIYSPSRSSLFFKNVQQVYSIVNGLDSAKKTTALYWDDNPNVSVLDGHLNYFIHKISPAGHWLMIAEQACMQNKESIVRSSYVCTLTTIALFDAFICCWDEKYKINLIRPITVINQFIDTKWKPFIQTPPFPEFTSGHAVISNAAATVLTQLLGDHFNFTDETEIPFGQKPRTFSSFYSAAYEVSMSRVYGGIHYPETARISIEQGKAIGSYVIKKLSPDKTRP